MKGVINRYNQPSIKQDNLEPMETSMTNSSRRLSNRGKSISAIVKTTVASIAVLVGATATSQADVERYPFPGGNAPISQAVEISNIDGLVFLSGATPLPADPSAEIGERAYYGDTRTQTLSVFNRIKENLEDKGLDMGDIIKLTVFLVGDPDNDGFMDRDGFTEAYLQFFGTAEQPNLPARSAFQIASLSRPLMFVEIEAIAVRDLPGTIIRDR